MWPFLAIMIVVFPDHTHYFGIEEFEEVIIDFKVSHQSFGEKFSNFDFSHN